MPVRKKSEKTKATDESRSSKRKKPGKSEKRYVQTIFRDWCKSCGICSAFCPKNVIGLDNGRAPIIVNPDDCIGCRFCELRCPDFAITIIDRNTEKGENRT